MRTSAPITGGSAESVDIKVGDPIRLLIKAFSVILVGEWPRARPFHAGAPWGGSGPPVPRPPTVESGRSVVSSHSRSGARNAWGPIPSVGRKGIAGGLRLV